jgi:quercetin dioxygenase-like cupin family protein
VAAASIDNWCARWQSFVSDAQRPFIEPLPKEKPMFQRHQMRAVRAALFAGAASLVAATVAFAGECPADKVGANPLHGAASAPGGVMENELSSIDLSKEAVRLDQRRLRLRHMEIQPGGVVPLHSHADRPALIMVNQGRIYEYSSKCTVPILHEAGEIARESNGLQHWWKNEGKQTVVLTIADIVNERKPETMMQHM